MKIFVQFFALFPFLEPEVFGQNEFTTKIFERSKIISKDLEKTPVCIFKRGTNKNEREYLYTNDSFNEMNLFNERMKKRQIARLILQKWRGLTGDFNTKYVFFTHPLNPRIHSLDFYKEYKWKLTPVWNFGEDIYEIENTLTKQFLLVKGDVNRETKPEDYIFKQRRFVFVENFERYYDDHS